MAANLVTTNHLPLLSTSTTKTILQPRSRLHATTETPIQQRRRPSFMINIPNIISNLLHMGTAGNPFQENHFIQDSYNRTTPAASPKENISSLQDELHGKSNWSNLLNPVLHPWLRRELIKYGDFAQATYDGFDYNPLSEYHGSALYNKNRLFEKLGLTSSGYNITKYIYAMSNIELPRWIEHSLHANTWSKDSNWMGFVAVSDDTESRRIGCRDIVVAWRGTVATTEWFENAHLKLESIKDVDEEDQGDAKVEHGFLSIYKSKSVTTRYNKSSASEQVITEIQRLVAHYRSKGEQVRLTVTGHSLGGALALLNAHEAASTIADLPVSVITFAGPRVGNDAFGDQLRNLNVKVLRVVVKQDVVPKLPGVLLNERLEKLEGIIGELQWVYEHVGMELRLDVKSSPYLKHHGFDLAGFHGLETYLHLVDGYVSEEDEYRRNARRDVALVNKYGGMLLEELRVPESWYQLENKGMVRNAYGRWVMPDREPEDIPSPFRDCRPLAIHESL
ncbi:phospholipase A1-Igamma1, chloroplastic-like [Dioscorea cayenensis subsp. rotundata]|uniref:Phospholipase A1-Igamma1, chloroplastic-like n=1 Tax=Dioscorea cayennensis subsp. rotundata TaxID=55577 RepID=A0AB40CFN3_DIOCR|nr:phospholipase A1-Igamma1, chloroplastic-like [Dioscorea cayenensis subsp. rotundata]